MITIWLIALMYEYAPPETHAWWKMPVVVSLAMLLLAEFAVEIALFMEYLILFTEYLRKRLS